MAAITVQASALFTGNSTLRQCGTGLRSSVQVKQSKLAAPLTAKSTLVVRAAAVEFPAEEFEVPTPDVPSTRMMADFLMTYGRTLKHLSASGDSVAAAGFFVLERVRVGVMSLLESSAKSAERQADEQELEQCLTELQKDLALIQKYQNSQPNRIAVQLASLRCIQAARLLQRL